MQLPAVEFKKIYERDMDLLILEEFLADRDFAQLFLSKLPLTGEYTVCKAAHSLADADGESDLTLILQYPEQRIALLIEDKIDAPTMPEQSERYHRRARNAEARGEYDRHFVVLAAPAAYHKEHEADRNAGYEYRVCYEELRDYLSQKNDLRQVVKLAMIDCALREKKAGYLAQEVPAVTRFWMELRQYCKTNYPQLRMVGEDAPKGGAARWPEFRTTLGTLKVVYKSQKGCVDLEFPQYGDRIADLLKAAGAGMTTPMIPCKTGKSASIRLENERWVLDFAQEFAPCQEAIDEVLQAVSLLCKLASGINYSDLY